MSVVKLKDRFFRGLKGSYPEEEIESFFYLLLEQYLNLSRLDLALDPNVEVSSVSAKRFESVVERLKLYEPIQYIIGSTEFMNLKFNVDSNVLIPRPETEELVEWIIKDAMGKKDQTKLSILDIGTGSGCIAITLAKNLFHANVDAMDISEKALAVARKNTVENGVEVKFFSEDILRVESLNEQYDIIVSNPPYVTLLDKKNMSPNVVDHEPEEALFVPKDDPLIFYKRILKLGETNLNDNGAMYFEINEYLSDDLMKLKEIQFFSNIELRKDIYGKDRMIKCTIDE